MCVVIVIVHCWNVRQQVFAIFIEIPVLPSGDIGVMGMRKTNRQAPGPIIMPASQVVKFSAGFKGHFIIVFHLVGSLGNTGTGYRAQVVIPPVDSFTGFAIIRGPTEIRRVDIGS